MGMRACTEKSRQIGGLSHHEWRPSLRFSVAFRDAFTAPFTQCLVFTEDHSRTFSQPGQPVITVHVPRSHSYNTNARRTPASLDADRADRRWRPVHSAEASGPHKQVIMPNQWGSKRRVHSGRTLAFLWCVSLPSQSSWPHPCTPAVTVASTYGHPRTGVGAAFYTLDDAFVLMTGRHGQLGNVS